MIVINLEAALNQIKEFPDPHNQCELRLDDGRTICIYALPWMEPVIPEFNILQPIDVIPPLTASYKRSYKFKAIIERPYKPRITTIPEMSEEELRAWLKRGAPENI